MKKITLTFIMFILLVANSSAQKADSISLEQLKQRIENLESRQRTAQRVTISGYIQVQYQHGQSEADHINFRFNRGNSFENNPYYPGTSIYKERDGFSRFGVRRGRLRVAWDDRFARAVIQLNATEAGVSAIDAFLDLRDVWSGSQSFFRMGLFDRYFGFENSFSSRNRESPERSRIVQTILPGVTDIGCMLTLQASETSPWSILKMQLSLVSGNGSQRPVDSRMDFIGRLSANKNFNNRVSLSGGTSIYLGGVRSMDSAVYVMENNRFVLESSTPQNIGRMMNRRYFGFDAQLRVETPLGTTRLQAEYIFGQHPGNSEGAYSFLFNAGNMPTGPVYMRHISGGYVKLMQDLGRLPITLLLKYDWYNPNTRISGSNIGAPGSGTETAPPFNNNFSAPWRNGNVAISTLGLGASWSINDVLRLTAYYEIVRNETSRHLTNIRNAEGQILMYGYEGIRPANVFTLRLQYRY
ncbi:MAG: hypothetical protein FWC94_00210 [Bacteroidales bacterium]|nr:hypothetical protein [Bacteroidales bacterium]